MDAPWTLDELTRRCGEALARVGLQQDNGQVADVPQGRAVRWYTSIGLLARPEQRGRVAYYGPRHLQQLVAIKRLQAQGLALSAVQQALAGKNNDDVAALAAVPADLIAAAVAEDTVTVSEPAPYRAFWAADVADADVAPVPAAPRERPTVSANGRVVVDVGAVTVVVPGVDDAQLPLLHEAVAGFVRELVARGLLATTPASAPTTPAKENDR
jgi:DNA-binding transcriptional MerR regulator